MAQKKSAVSVSEKAKSQDEGVIIPRSSFAETGRIGLNVVNGRIIEEANAAFQYPRFIYTVDEMVNNSTVGAALNVYDFMLTKPDWKVTASPSASDITKERAVLINTMLNDMDHSFRDFINNVSSYLRYGYALFEPVRRRRLRMKGSRFNDGVIGIRKLAFRSQTTIDKWIFSDDGNDLLRVRQTTKIKPNGVDTAKAPWVELDMKDLLHFTCNSKKSNPEGASLLKNIYLPFKQMELLREHQFISIAKDAQGMLKIEAPVNYFSDQADANEKTTIANFQAMLTNHANGTLGGMLVPNQTDLDTKAKLFSYELLENKGSAKVSVQPIIQSFQQDILTALNVDILRLGADGTGSFALADSKTSILALAIDCRLREIKDVLNHQLIPMIYQWNGWSQEELPEFVYESPEEVDLETFSKAIQRIMAVNGVEVDREIMNLIRVALGAKPKPEDEPINEDQLPLNMTPKGEVQSGSGKGMGLGKSGNGTADIGGDSSSKDNSTANKEN